MHVSAIVLSLVAIASAAPAEQLQRRADTICGSAHYTSSQVTAAAKASCNFVGPGTVAGTSTYPHQYKNFEGFNFKGLSGPFYEFPIKSGGVYNGGSPGADRVIINKKCQLAGVITHTNAPTSNGFIACSENQGSKDDEKSSAAIALENSLLRAVSGTGAALMLYTL